VVIAKLLNVDKIRLRYQSDDEVTSAVGDYFEDQKETFFKTGIQMLKHLWKKCVDLKGDYVEK